MAPVTQALANDSRFEHRVCVTAQHREMLDQVLELFNIVPDYDLNLMKPGQDLARLTSSLISNLMPIMEEYRPDLVLVHGDTTTTLAASLTAFYAGVSVGHVEAGLRTGNIYAPWPEEVNRRIASVVTRFHFAPTVAAQRNLLRENIDEKFIHVTGNTVVDALLSVIARLKSDEEMHAKVEKEFKFLPIQRKLILVTGHRRENFGDGFENICKAIQELATQNKKYHFVYPVHLNPNVKEPVNRLIGGLDNVSLIDPLSYLPFCYLMNRSALILTDSGGIQEEAPSLGKPVLLMRETTERPEAVASGSVKLVGTDPERIVNMVISELEKNDSKDLTNVVNPYGDGKAALRIVNYLAEML